MRWCALGRNADGRITAFGLNELGDLGERTELAPAELVDFVRATEAAQAPRWVWNDTAKWLPGLLKFGVRVTRCHDLRLAHAILARSALVPDPGPLRAAAAWAVGHEDPDPEPQQTTLFELDAPRLTAVPGGIEETLAEFARQRAALASAPGQLALLVAAESAGALIAAELREAGVPWDATEHDRILTDALGPRPATGARPEIMARLAEEIARALGNPRVSVDSPPKLLRAMRDAGLDVQSTSQWEIAEVEHPVIPPLLHYKKLSRLLTANGWNWIDEWVRDGRYHPVYVPGGVVTGRWASSGGGALQLPRLLRPALRADPGWTFVSADVAQLEPRVLAAMSGDRAMAAAGAGTDLYAGVVDSGVVATRQDAKIAVLGAMYGATTGDSGRLVPRLRRGFPDAMRLVDQAAETGERGGIVTTWLGRSSPLPGDEWLELQARATLPGASARDEREAKRVARDFGRFTRNFIVQGTAAEWALAWLADLRLRLNEIVWDEAGDVGATPARASGPAFARRPHLAFFLHDEIIVHTPIALAEQVTAAVTESAAAAGRLLFGQSPVDFPLDVRVAERAAKD
ncbi:bifunctional 3'-5' exonuclease/DNA polymerase [Leucobacter salsicius]|uniref:bifunctional 3'-5' exonuclease/DNA polymerase n=1 Tax=Leucobacter salsicius TaxID=664638 RepID=UPI000376ECB1|nr:bifunctional 3'-5' exonuclease/DNA polymerase [Leucobacter salsicius]